LYDPSTGAFTPAGAMTNLRGFHGHSAGGRQGPDDRLCVHLFTPQRSCHRA
jgi:hypothetical protein